MCLDRRLVMTRDVNPDDFQGMRYKIIFRLLEKIERKHLHKIGLYHGQTKYLVYIMRNPGCKQNDLIKYYSLSAPTMAKTTRRLEEKGLIIKKQDQTDMRVTRIFPTDNCEELLRKSVEIHTNIYNTAFVDFDTEEKEQFESYLKRMEKNLNQQENS